MKRFLSFIYKSLNHDAMKNFIGLVVLVSLVATTACKKNPELPAPVDRSTVRVKTMVYKDSAGTVRANYTFFYDGSGRLVRMNTYQASPGYTYVYRYKYLPNTIIEEISDTALVLEQRTTYTLNANGLIASGIQKYYTHTGDSTWMYNFTYQYNADGFLVGSKWSFRVDTLSSTTQTWQISGGNIISYADYDYYSHLILSETYDYYPNTTSTTGNINLGRAYLGKSSTNLVKTTTVNNDPFSTATCNYTFDSNNRESSVAISNAYGRYSLWFTYY